MGLRWWLTLFSILTIFWAGISLICIAFTGKTYDVFSWYWWILAVISGPIAVHITDKILKKS
jgi:hypothetical protein